MANRPRPPNAAIIEFWEGSPLCASGIAAEPGSREFFAIYDALRQQNEPHEFAMQLHEYGRFHGKRVLEVGCGNAYTLAKYAEHGAQVFGLDLTKKAIDVSKRRFDIGGIDGEFHVGNAEQLPFGDNTFDCICSMGVLHHVSNTESATEEIYRCLKPGGRLIVMLYHRNSLLYRVWMPVQARRRRKSIQRLVNEVDGVGNPKGDVYSKGEMKHLLRSFSSIEMFCGCLNIGPRYEVLIPKWLRKPIDEHYGWFLYAKAYKPT
jgi:ubiquinone/menaquinone biosynthesis C-methylase UbiE